MASELPDPKMLLDEAEFRATKNYEGWSECMLAAMRTVAREEIERTQQQPAKVRQEPAKPAGVRVRVTEEAVYAAEEANTVHSTFRDDLEAAAPHMEVTVHPEALFEVLADQFGVIVSQRHVAGVASGLGLTLSGGDSGA